MTPHRGSTGRGSYIVGTLIALGTILTAGMCQSAFGAPPLCVNTAGTGGCYSTIQAAVAAAKPSDTILVASDTYREDVMIGHRLTLIGAGPHTTVINASGQSNGIYVDGKDNPGLRNVVVTGFTVENANLQGILVTNASDITVQNNILMGNDKNLGSSGCTGLPGFEIPGENLDCGGGIHLLAVNHSTVADNTVEHNSDGILLTDETGPTFDNLVAGNKVEDNLFDCGITLASHSPKSGVYDNTIADNVSEGNGKGIPGAGIGAGVGLFAAAPHSRTSGNVVTGNHLMENGGPGVALHSHTPDQDLNDNVLTANWISNNGPDNGGAPTPGTTGINVYGVHGVDSDIAGTAISHNTIQNEDDDIVVNTGALVKANLNNLLGGDTGAYGVYNGGSGNVDARRNWWGCAGGPNASWCSAVSGSGVFFAPWMRRAIR